LTDLRTDASRKNPQASLAAFKQAFPTDPDVRLLVKTNGKSSGDQSGSSSRLRTEIAADLRVILVEQTLAYDQVMAIYSSADVFLSLHRSEGLGLGPMEAMLLGKLAIATGYSGNMGYMTEVNSLPVAYRLVEPTHAGWQFLSRFAGRNAHWADADIQDAANSLQWARQNPLAREALARVGCRDVKEKQSAAWNAPYLSQLMRYLANSDRVGLRQKFKTLVQLNEVKDPTLRKLNLQALLIKLGLGS
jgi:glycosyltransferase involved in cell wall biosynthesis